MEKVTDRAKIVTDELVLSILAAQGMDKDYVELFHDYAPRNKGKEYSPNARFYRDRVSGKRVMTIDILPHITNAGFFILSQFRQAGNKFISEENCFHAEIRDRTIKVACVNDQPNGRKQGDWAEWRPQVFLDGIEQSCGNPIWLETDHMNRNYHFNVLEWDYGFCQRRARIIEGRLRDRITLLSDPHYEVQVANNVTGNMRLKFGSRDARGISIGRVVGDVEIISKEELAKAEYPITIGASPETFYPDDSANSCDAYPWQQYPAYGGPSWAGIRGAAGSDVSDVDNTPVGFLTNRDNGTYMHMYRPIAVFDTSPIPPAANITGASYFEYGHAKDETLCTPSRCIYEADPASFTEIIVADYNKFDITGADDRAYCDTPITYGNYNIGDPGAVNEYVLNALGLSGISKTSSTPIGAREAAWEAPNIEPSWAEYEYSYISAHATNKGAGYKPYFIVTYEVVVGWAGGDVSGVAIAAIAKINGIPLADIAKVNGI